VNDATSDVDMAGWVAMALEWKAAAAAEALKAQLPQSV
jgi:hypothetical protein